MNNDNDLLGLAASLGFPSGPLLQTEQFVKSPSARATVMHIRCKKSDTPRALCRYNGPVIDHAASWAHRMPICSACSKRHNWPNVHTEHYVDMLHEFARLRHVLADARTQLDSGTERLALLHEVDEVRRLVCDRFSVVRWSNIASIDPDGTAALETFLDDLRRDADLVSGPLRTAVRNRSLDKVSLQCATQLIWREVYMETTKHRRESWWGSGDTPSPTSPTVLDLVEIPAAVSREALRLLEQWSKLRALTAAPVSSRMLLDAIRQSDASAEFLTLSSIDDMPEQFLVHDASSFTTPLAWASAEWDSAWERAAVQITGHCERLLQQYLAAEPVILLLRRGFTNRVATSDAYKIADVIATSVDAVAVRTSYSCAQYMVDKAADVDVDVFGGPIPGDTPVELVELAVELVHDGGWSSCAVSAASAVEIATAVAV